MAAPSLLMLAEPADTQSHPERSRRMTVYEIRNYQSWFDFAHHDILTAKLVKAQCHPERSRRMTVYKIRNYYSWFYFARHDASKSEHVDVD